MSSAVSNRPGQISGPESGVALAQRVLPAKEQPNLALVLRGVRTHANEDAGMIARRDLYAARLPTSRTSVVGWPCEKPPSVETG